MAEASAVETPSGKSASTENFPVGSILISSHLRPHVAAFYAFARVIDDIADDPDLLAEEKIRRLDSFEQTLLGHDQGRGYEKARHLSDSLAICGVTTQHGRDLVAAFRQDAIKSRYASWDELMGYCRLSAAPVGRYLIDLHGGDPSLYQASDALCAALQVINHLQDCQDDLVALDRVYLPGDWMADAGMTIDDLAASTATPAVRRVIDQCLAGCRRLIAQTGPLRQMSESRRLSLESAVIIEIANALIIALEERDPLAARVTLSKPRLVVLSLSGVAKGLLRAA